MTTAEIDNYIQLGLLILTATSILSPIIVAWINHHYDFKIRKFEYITKVKQQALSNFANYSMDRFDKNKSNFYSAFNQLYAYFDIDDKLASNLIYGVFSSTNHYQKAVSEFIQNLSKQLKSK